MDRPSGVSTWDRDAYDNFKYCVHELFLYVVAILLKHEQIEIAHFVISSPYVVSTASGRKVASFLAFREHAVSFDTRGQRTKRLSARADLLKELCSGVFVDYSGLMQADFVCYLRAALREEQWWPETLLFAAYQYGPFELFARASSHRYLTTLLPLFGIVDVGQLRVQLELLSRRGREAVPWRFEGLSVATLANLEGMGSME